VCVCVDMRWCAFCVSDTSNVNAINNVSLAQLITKLGGEWASVGDLGTHKKYINNSDILQITKVRMHFCKILIQRNNGLFKQQTLASG